MIDITKSLRFVAEREAKEREYHVTEHIDWMAADEIERLWAIEIAVRKLEPYFDQLICYASTPSEYKPNLLVKNMKEALAAKEDTK